MEKNGWVKIHRKMLQNPIVMKDAEHFAVWLYLLLNASHDDYPALFKGKKIILKPGQLITGCVSIGRTLCISESKVRRCLDMFISDGQIDRQTSNKNSLITVLNWEKYQLDDRQIVTQLTDNRQTTDGQLTTNKNIKKDKNERNKEIYNADFSEKAEEIISYLNSVCSTHYRWQTESTKKHIHARLEEGRTVEDFKTVINKKHREWSGTDMAKYLCPDTLFGTKFEKYLNQPDHKAEIKKPNFQNYERQNYNFAELERQLLQN